MRNKVDDLTEAERKQIDTLRGHQIQVRAHEDAATRRRQCEVRLSAAETDEQTHAARRETTKANLLGVLSEV